jgi:hypothetical protein
MYFLCKAQYVHVFHSRSTFSLLKTNGLLSGSHEQLSQYTYTAAAGVVTAVWFVTLHTFSMEWIMYAELRIGVIL